MKINTNIQFTKDEQEVISIIKNVIEKYTPTTQAFLVGGFVRDKLLGIPSNDIDIMTTISGADFAHLVTKYLNIDDPHVIKENPDKSKFLETATANIPLSSGEIQEIDFAQARSEVYHENSRIPEIKPATPQEDAYRRDLTINTLTYDVLKGELVDFTGKGLKDLITGTIRTPEDPLKTFKDDPLRIFRTIRFASKYNSNIDEETYKAMLDPSLREDIKQKISKERIGVEITKMLKNPNPENALKLLKDTGLWQDIVTEALKGTKYENKMEQLDMEQNNPWHNLTIWGHTMQVVKNVLEKYPEAEPEKRTTMILAALMHDMGKLYKDIQAESVSHPGNTSYHGHEKESKEIVEHILRYLKMEPFINQVSGIARQHMRLHPFAEGEKTNLKTLRKFIRKMGEQSLNWLDILNISIADAQSKDIEINPLITEKYQALENQLQEALSSLQPIQDKNSITPILNGNEIMQILNIKPGKWMSDITEFVKELRDENPNITKEEATIRLKTEYGHLSEDQINPENITTAGNNKNKTSSTCPMHLFKQRQKEICTLKKEKKYYEILTILNELKKNYGKDENVIRLIAINILPLLIRDEKFRDNNLIQHIFTKAKSNFFDPVLCSFVVGILILLKTSTHDEIVLEIGERMTKMAPGLLRMVLEMLPKEIANKHLKMQLIKGLK